MLTLTERLAAFQSQVATKQDQQDQQIAYFAEISKAMLMMDGAWAETLVKALRGGDANPDNATWTRAPFWGPEQQ
jgi:hypothetical protein